MKGLGEQWREALEEEDEPIWRRTVNWWKRWFR